jgi:hypothetical protein
METRNTDFIANPVWVGLNLKVTLEQRLEGGEEVWKEHSRQKDWLLQRS